MLKVWGGEGGGGGRIFGCQNSLHDGVCQKLQKGGDGPRRLSDRSCLLALLAACFQVSVLTTTDGWRAREGERGLPAAGASGASPTALSSLPAAALGAQPLDFDMSAGATVNSPLSSPSGWSNCKP